MLSSGRAHIKYREKIPIDEAVFCGLVQGHSGILSFFVFVPVSETVHELITGTRVQFSAFRY
jgi:hypothetical protein